MSKLDLGFTYRAFKSGLVEIHHHGVLAATLRGTAAQKFLNAASDPGRDLQQVMARLTGNYRRGNEGAAAGHPRNRV
jgi:hypothetical protein